jgi:hypothetical protein
MEMSKRWVVAFVVALVMAGVGRAYGASCVFEGGQSDLWSAAANWTGGVKPEAGDDVVVAGDCQLDEDVPALATLSVSGGKVLTTNGRAVTTSGTFYLGGTLNGGASTVTVGGSLDWDQSGAVFNRGTSTVVMNGSGTVYINGNTDDFHNFTCGAAGQATGFWYAWPNVWGTATLGAGTVNLSGSGCLQLRGVGTPLVNAGATMNMPIAYVTHADGTVNVAGGVYNGGVTVGPYAQDINVNVNYVLAGDLTTSYLNLRNEKWGTCTFASSGHAVATTGAMNLGNGSSRNMSISFGASAVTVGGSLSVVRSGDPFSVDFSTAAVSVAGNVSIPSDISVSASTSGWAVSGTGSRSLDLGEKTFGEVSVANTGGWVTFLSGYKAGKVTIAAGANVNFRANRTTEAGEIDWQGTSAAPITLRSTVEGIPQWFLKLTGDQAVSYVDVMDCNATSGQTVDGTANCVDNGNNLGWTFSGGGLPSPTPRYWVAGTAGGWGDAANWAETSGGQGGASVPGEYNDVFFDGNGLGDCSLSAATTCRSLTLASGYSGTLGVGANDLTVKVDVALQGGLFDGGSAQIRVRGNWTAGASRFAAGTGSVLITGAARGGAIITSGGCAFNALTIDGSERSFSLADALTVNGNFVQQLGALDTTANNFGIAVGGNYVLGDALTANGSTVTVGGNLDWDQSGAVFNRGTSTVVLTGSAGVYLATGTKTFHNLTCAYSGKTVTLNDGFGSIYVANQAHLCGGTLAKTSQWYPLVVQGLGNSLLLDSGTVMGSLAWVSLAPGEAGTVTVPAGTYFALQLNSGERAVTFNLAGDIALSGYDSASRSLYVWGKYGAFNTNGYAVTGLTGSRDFAFSTNWDWSMGRSFGASTVVCQRNVSSVSCRDNVFSFGSSHWTVNGSFSLSFSDGSSTGNVLDWGSSELRVKGDMSFASVSAAQWLAGTSKFVLDGAAAQSVSLAGRGPAALEVANTVGTLTFSDAFVVDSCKLVAGASATFAAGKIYRAAHLDWQGAAGNLVTVRSTASGSPWRLVLGGNYDVDYVDVKDSDGSDGLTVYAGANSVDSGGNSNWVFDAKPENSAPLAVGDGYVVEIGTPKVLNLKAFEPDGDPVTFVLDSQPENGTLSDFDSATGAITYTPFNGYRGVDTFTFHVNDGAVDSNVATASMLVDVRVFRGTRSSSWALAENWLGWFKPVSYGWDPKWDSVIIDADCTFDVAPPALGSMTINAGKTLSVGAYSIALNGGWDCQGTFEAGTSTVTMQGSGSVTLKGSASFYNFKVHKSGYFDYVALSGPLVVQNDLAISYKTLDVTAANYPITVGHNFINSAGQNGTFKARQGTVTLNGNGAQTLNLGGAQAWNIVVTNTTGPVNIQNNLTARTLTLPAGVTATFGAGNTYKFTDVSMQGTAEAPITLRSSTTGTQWKLVIPEHKAVYYVDVKDSDASGGSAVTDVSGQDSGNNLSWLFRTPAYVAITTPTTSLTSPAWVEGDCGADVTSLQVSVNGGTTFEATPETPIRWFADNAASGGASLGITLSPDSPTDVSVTARNGLNDESTDTQSIYWGTTDIPAVPSTVTIRKGDSLLLTASGTGDEIEIDADGDGTFELSGEPGDAFPVAYNTAGTFTAVAKIDGVELGSLFVTVVSVDIHGPIACQVGFVREKDALIAPVDSMSSVSLLASNPKLLSAQVKEATTGGCVLQLSALERGSMHLQARVGGDTGPLAAATTVDSFVLTTQGSISMFVNGNTCLARTEVLMTPYIPDVRVEFSTFAHQSKLVRDGEEVTSFFVDTSEEFAQMPGDEFGEMAGRFVCDFMVPPDEVAYCFNIKVYQASSAEKIIGAGGGNGNAFRLRLDLAAISAQAYANGARPNIRGAKKGPAGTADVPVALKLTIDHNTVKRTDNSDVQGSAVYPRGGTLGLPEGWESYPKEQGQDVGILGTQQATDPAQLAVGMYDVLAPASSLEPLGGTEDVEFAGILTVYDTPAAGTMAVIDAIRGKSQRATDDAVKILYAGSRPVGEARTCVLVFDFAPPTGEAKADYSWSIIPHPSVPTGWEDKSGDWDATQAVIRELTVSDTNTRFLVKCIKKADQSVARQVEVRAVRVIARGFSKTTGASINEGDRKEANERVIINSSGGRVSVAGGYTTCAGCGFHYRLEHGTDLVTELADVSWDVTAMGNLERVNIPEPPKGPGGAISDKYIGMFFNLYPNSNAAFGEKIITTAFAPNDTVNIWQSKAAVFYPPHLDVKAAGQMKDPPAWFAGLQSADLPAWGFYCSQEGGGPCSFSIDTTTGWSATVDRFRVATPPNLYNKDYSGAGGVYFWGSPTEPDVLYLNRDLRFLLPTYVNFQFPAKGTQEYLENRMIRNRQAYTDIGKEISYLEIKTRNLSLAETLEVGSCHERTHRELNRNSQAKAKYPSKLSAADKPDADGDRVNDAWEVAFPGLLPSTSDSFGEANALSNMPGDKEFNETTRDNEFYAWICLAFNQDYVETLRLHKWDGDRWVVTDVKDQIAQYRDRYHGIIPDSPDNSKDWSVGGHQWNNWKP